MEILVVPADGNRPDGPEVVRKTADLPGERERLLREAAVLRAASERGVAGLATVVTLPAPDAESPCLVTAAVAGPSLAAAAPLPALEVAGVAAEVARLLGALHDAGLVHGAVEPGHVVLDGEGGVILVGLGDGGLAGAPSPDATAGPLDPAADVAGWGLLVSHLLDWSATTDEEPLVALRQSLASRRARRTRRQPVRTRSDQDERRVLAALADQAQDADPARRPAARSLAAAVAHRIPRARLPGAVALAPLPAGPELGLLERLSAHVGHGPAAAPGDGMGPTSPDEPADPTGGGGGRPAPAVDRRALGERRWHRSADRLGSALRAGRREEAGAGSAPTPSSATTPAPIVAAADGPPARPRRPEASTSAGRRWALAGGVAAITVLAAWLAVARLRAPERPTAGATQPGSVCPPAAGPAADVDGDGCDEPVRWSDGVLQAGAARFALGAPGDAWAVGDWDCDGRRTPALLHGGVLAVFDAWPGPGGDVRGREVAAPPGATGLIAVAGPDGCDRPSLSRAGGAALLVDVPKAP